MTDGLGNPLEPGNYLYWKSKEMVVRVVHVMEPKIKGNDQPPALVLQIAIPVNGVRAGDPIILGDFLRVVDPAATQALAGILEGAGRPQ